jgi:hypothetical protein
MSDPGSQTPTPTGSQLPTLTSPPTPTPHPPFPQRPEAYTKTERKRLDRAVAARETYAELLHTLRIQGPGRFTGLSVSPVKIYRPGTLFGCAGGVDPSLHAQARPPRRGLTGDSKSLVAA